MKIIYSIFIALFLLLTCNQAKGISLEWDNLDFAGSVKADDNLLPYYAATLKPDIDANDYTVVMSYPVYEKLGFAESKKVLLKYKDISDVVVINKNVGVSKKEKLIDVSFLPFIKKGRDVYRLSSFELEISPVIEASNLRSAVDYKTNSVLSKGIWKKISVSKSGVYMLTYQDIVSMGIDPQKVQIYGYGGFLLDEDFSKSNYKDDLPEVAVWKHTGSDGVFNTGDYILFYANGTINWKKNTNANTFYRVRNHYSDKAYYFVGEREQGTLVSASLPSSNTYNVTVTDFTDYILHESERVNIGESVASSGTGRELYGEDFISNNNQTFPFKLTDINLQQPVYLQSEFIANNAQQSTCDLSVNGNLLHTMSMSGISTSNLYTYATSSLRTSSFSPGSDDVSVKLTYNRYGNSSNPKAFLNYITLNYRRKLRLSGSQVMFRDPLSVGVGKIANFVVSNANASTRVFDITDPNNMVLIEGTLSENNYIFNAASTSLREYVCVDLNGSFEKPVIEGNVKNQNLHSYESVCMVIISPDIFRDQALRLAKAHTEYDGINVLVVSPDQIYNEFSSGTPDATAYRRMMKFYYDKAGEASSIPKYLLLFGGGVYDNRKISAAFLGSAVSKFNHLLTYQSVESLEGTQSFVTDDYFGFLDDNEGANLSLARLDIGIGRFPVNTVQQAEWVVDKTISYMQNARKGPWKNRLLYVADDGDDNVHMEQAETLAASVEKNFPEFMVNRIYVDAYKKVITASGATIPDGEKKLGDLINSGLLMINYTGHGSTKEWTSERILKYEDVNNLTNKSLPLWVTATCDFTRYDAPEYSSGEMVFLNRYGGGVALYTTTRIVYSSNNFVINKSFTENIFSKSNGVRNSLGEIMHLTKSSESLRYDRNKLSFTLIGDPALKLAYPEFSVKVTHVNNNQVSAVIDTFKALEKVKITGQLYKEDGSPATDFNGYIFPTVMDSKDLVKTLGSDGADIFTYFDQSKVVFTGKDTVANGVFSFTFVVPKDISYSFQPGSMNFYAYDMKSRNEAQGYYKNFALGGSGNSSSIDTIGPNIQLYLNSESFTEGSTVNETPTFIAKVSDESGLNTSGNGIGHDFHLIIDDDASLSFVLNNYYMGDIGSYNSGIIRFALPLLSEGWHTLKFRAWDVHNNSGVKTMKFKVSNGFSPKLSGLRYVQNSSDIVFRFSHDRPEVAVNVKIQVFDLTGRMVWQEEEKMQAGTTVSDEFIWNTKNNDISVSDGGIFICKVLVTDSNGSSTFISEKLRLTPQ